ncbi:mycofactocin-coupled SDR family oxidoreductase [Mycolicibacterium litorale]|nr:mycofactocin-coupled SDR family oxidoreductase [Mycolicibacterium litorale]
MSQQLRGKIAVVTGAARGQGRSHAVRLAQEGADIVAMDLCDDVPGTPYPGATEADLHETVRLVEETGSRIVARKADVRDLAQVRAVVDEGVDVFGGLDIVAANAGVTVDPAVVEDIEEDIWRNVIDINLNGVFRTVKASIPHLRANPDGGSIVLTGSTAATRGFPNVADYTASKHGVTGLMRSLALELGQYNIRVNSINPTQVDTDMIQHDAYYRLFNPHLAAPTREDFAEASSAVHVLPVPWVESVDVSNALVFLVSDQARYITGAALPVDAGRNLR